MDYELYSDVVLLCDLPEGGVLAGDVGKVVAEPDIGLESDYSVEFFDMVGNTVAVVTVPGSSLRSPTQADRPTVRPAKDAAA